MSKTAAKKMAVISRGCCRRDRQKQKLTPNRRGCVNILRNLTELVNASWKPDEITEDSLTVIAYDPIAPAFLGKIKDAHYYENDKELSSSKWRKSFQQASNVAGRKLDSRSIDITASDDTIFSIYIMEVKTADRSKNRPDLVKLATMLKDKLRLFALSHGKDRQSSDFKIHSN